MPQTQQQRSAATRTKLLDATIAVLIEHGYANTSTTRICKQAGLSRGAQVHHFPNKAHLLAAAIEHLFHKRHQELRVSLGQTPALETVLQGLWHIYSGPTLHAWMELLVAARTDAELRAQLRSVDDRFFEQAKATCRQLLHLDGVDERQVATLCRLILSVLDGLALNYTLGQRDQLKDLVLQQLGAMLAERPAAQAIG